MKITARIQANFSLPEVLLEPAIKIIGIIQITAHTIIKANVNIPAMNSIVPPILT